MSSRTPGSHWGQASCLASVSVPAAGLQPEKRKGNLGILESATTSKLERGLQLHESPGLRPRQRRVLWLQRLLGYAVSTLSHSLVAGNQASPLLPTLTFEPWTFWRFPNPTFSSHLPQIQQFRPQPLFFGILPFTLKLDEAYLLGPHRSQGTGRSFRAQIWGWGQKKKGEAGEREGSPLPPPSLGRLPDLFFFPGPGPSKGPCGLAQSSSALTRGGRRGS